MEINIRKTKDAVILDLKGNFDVNASNFIEKMGELLRQGFKGIVCNFENVNMVDYMGLSGLAIAYRNVANHKASLKFYNVPVHIKNIFSLLMLDKIFEIHPGEAEAVASIREKGVFARLAKKKLRRRFKRLPINLEIKFRPKYSSSQDYFEGKIFNLSASGVFIYTEKVFNLNDILRLRLFLGSEKEVIELDARVLWLADKKLQPQFCPGMGVEFYKASNKLEKKIISFVNRNISRTSPSDS